MIERFTSLHEIQESNGVYTLGKVVYESPAIVTDERGFPIPIPTASDCHIDFDAYALNEEQERETLLFIETYGRKEVKYPKLEETIYAPIGTTLQFKIVGWVRSKTGAVTVEGWKTKFDFVCEAVGRRFALVLEKYAANLRPDQLKVLPIFTKKQVRDYRETVPTVTTQIATVS